ncbi:MAG: response regulator, partial [Desulfobulbaceae bacterium]|nr:response regulator [Desulfobulbaceae bacterium]
DHKMPEMSGTELAAEIKKLYPGLPIILVTGWYKELHGDEVKFDKIMKKPIDLDQLISAVSSVCGADDTTREVA